MKYHADLLTPQYWQVRKQRILDGQIEDVFPYPQELRFRHAADTQNDKPVRAARAA
jgi:isocitrate dehydrogenase kinase/phosphatase